MRAFVQNVFHAFSWQEFGFDDESDPESCFAEFFQRDGEFVFLSGHENHQRIAVDTGVREVISSDEHSRASEHAMPHYSDPRLKCDKLGLTLKLDGFRGQHGIMLVDARGSERRLITVKGRKLGFHDYVATIRDMGFSASCEFARFTFGGKLMVVDIATGKVAAL